MKPALHLLITAAGVGAGFVVMLWTGFHLHHQPAPPPIDTIFPPAVLILAGALTWLIRLLATRAGDAAMRRRYKLRSRRELRAERETWERERRERIARLAADPLRARYAEAMERGEQWSDAQIDYDLDSSATATCEHLAPVERAMRDAGIRIKLQFPPIVHAECLIDEAELQRRFALTPPAGYRMLPQYDDRGFEDPPAAALCCDAHNARIHVRLPELTPPGTPVFPA